MENSKKEPIKASTLSQFYWCAIESYIEHLRELGDERVGPKKETVEMKEGESFHEQSFGLYVTQMEEDTGRTILERMKDGKVTAVNHGDYQIQGAPDEVVQEKDGTAKIKELKTTTNDVDKNFYEKYQMPRHRFQVQIYSWMLVKVPDISVENPIITVKKRKEGQAEYWYEKEVEFDKREVEGKIDEVLELFQSPEKLADYRPSVDWKCKNDNHWDLYRQIVLDKA